jgi:dipeptide/tripeptide permease
VPEQERPHKEHIRHEAVTMALYVAICLLAALAALKGTVLEHGVVFELVWGTTVGLALAHMFAFLLAGRLIEGRRITAATRATILAQLVGAAAVALLVTIAIVLVPTSDELDAARVDLAVIIGITGYVVSRNVARTRLRAVLFAIIVTAVGLAVAAIKYWVGH